MDADLETGADFMGAEEFFGEIDRCATGIVAVLDCRVHDADEGWPVDAVWSTDALRSCVEEARQIGRGKDVAFFIEPAASCATEHLQKFIGPQFDCVVAGLIARACDHDAAHGEIDAGSESGGGNDDAQMAAFGERLDQPGANGVGESAVMPGHAIGEEFCERFSC